tara:strand:- start:211 stop:471 length:261 start_codon:yes stop_codon:yes gene_type:complete
MEAGKLGLPSKDGLRCIYLSEDNKCSIYDNRPDICRTENVYEHFKHKLTKKEYYIQSTKMCHKLIDKHKLNSSYKISLKEYENVER